MTRIIILVLSCRQPPYNRLHEAQRRTWDSIEVSDVTTCYYWCDDLTRASRLLREELDRVWGLDWDYLFRTNASSYVDKDRLLEHARWLPRERYYQGIDGGGFASGSGFFLSRDLAMILRASLPNEHPELVEDEVVAEVLRPHHVINQPGAERIDFWPRPMIVRQRAEISFSTETLIHDAYHIRCKSDTADREKDIMAMEEVHQIKLGFPR